MKIFNIIFIFFIFLAAMQALSAPFRRQVSFEWEPIPGAAAYDIELRPIKVTGESKTFKFSSVTNNWSGNLAPGLYQLRLKSKDQRGVGGEWSKPEEFQVKLEGLKLVAPMTEKVYANQAEVTNVVFQWEPLGGAMSYQLTILNEDGSTLLNQELKANQFSVPLKVAKNYTWSLDAKSVDGLGSEEPIKKQLQLLGPKLDAPVIEMPDNAFVRELKWKKPRFGEKFDLLLQKRDPASNSYKQVYTAKDMTFQGMEFPRSWPGGDYKLQIRSTANLREPSKVSEIRFPVQNGDRSPAAEVSQLLRNSIDRTSGFFGIASWFITNVKFQGNNPEHGATSSFQASAGTGRLGAGYLSPVHPFGFVGFVDLSGFILNSKNYTYPSAELNIIYRTNSGDRAEIRHQIGGFYKEIIDIYATGSSGEYVIDRIASVGPHYGIEYWYAFNPKIGFQLNAHTYLSLFKVKTPNDNAIDPSLSFQIGLMGSYRMNKKATGLLGYAYRRDTLAYKATEGNSGSSTQSLANSGDYNQTELTGHYLNLLMEYAF